MARIGWLLAGVLALFTIASIATEVSGGPLDPPGSPSSTLKTLEEIPGTWSRILTSSGGDSCATQRFDCVLDLDEAVLDNETGLVWERNPSGTSTTWDDAQIDCA